MKKNIIIYGAGHYGKCLYHFLKSMEVTVDFFCQTVCDGDSYYDGVKIISKDELSEKSREMIILIAICDVQISKCIKTQLLNMNHCNVRIYELGTFITQNVLDILNENRCFCNICGNQVNEFEGYTFAESEVFIRHRVSGGGGKRNNVICPICGSRARFRWMYWVLGKYTTIFIHKCSVLHIAPEEGIMEGIQANKLCDYYTGNINRSNTSMHIVDATSLQFKDDYFDYVIMNHVLEHIEDEAKAIMELKRVLKPGGKLILSFPICTDMDTYENTNAKTPEERLKEFGQKDHVRLYGKDYKERLAKYGLKIETYSPQDKCSKEEIIKYGFDYDDIISVCTY